VTTRRSPQRIRTGKVARPTWLDSLGVMLAVLTACLAATALPAWAARPGSLVADLEQRLAGGGFEAVHAHLSAHWSSAMVPLNQKTAGCELDAVSLAVRLSRSAGVKEAQAHHEALRAAVGRCTGFVLAVSALQEVPKVCASVEAWTMGHTARELRRRIAAIESDPLLRASPRGQSCRAAYLHELQNTRVVLRSQPPGAALPGK